MNRILSFWKTYYSFAGRSTLRSLWGVPLTSKHEYTEASLASAHTDASTFPPGLQWLFILSRISVLPMDSEAGLCLSFLIRCTFPTVYIISTHLPWISSVCQQCAPDKWLVFSSGPALLL